VAPYCWYYDQSLALPALLYGAARTQSRMLLAVLAGIYLVVTLQPLYSKPESALYVWPAVAWLVWYVFPSPRWPVSSPRSPVSGC